MVNLMKYLGGTITRIEVAQVLERHRSGCDILCYHMSEDPNPGGIGKRTWFEVLDEEQVMVAAGVVTEEMTLPTPPGMVPLDSGACAGVEDTHFTSLVVPS